MQIKCSDVACMKHNSSIQRVEVSDMTKFDGADLLAMCAFIWVNDRLSPFYFSKDMFDTEHSQSVVIGLTPCAGSFTKICVA